MKKVITAISVILLMVTLTNAQIKKSNVKLNTTKINSGISIQQGLKVNKLSKLKSLGDFKKLNIPTQQVTKELLNKKPTRTWKINPRKLSDGSLKLNIFNGIMSQTRWVYGDGTWDEDLDEYLQELSEGRDTRRGRISTWRLQIEFRVSGGVEYRLKLKGINSTENIDNKYIYVSRSSRNGNYISRINMNELNEYNYIFKEPNSSEVELLFTAIPVLRENRDPRTTSRVNSNHWQRVGISEIRIDRID